MPPRIDLSRPNQVKADPYASRTHRRIDLILFVLTIIILFVLLRSSARAANVSWTDATNKWESNNWTGGVGTNPPTAADTAIIGNGGIVNYDATTGTRTVLALQVGNPNIGNGTLNISAGSLTVTNNITISGQGNTSGTINITGTGSLNVGGIVQDGGNGPSTVTLNGGTLDLASDGSPGSIAVNTFNAQSGTLRNVSQIFLGDNTTVTALTKTTSGTLTLSGTNSYTGGTAVNAGTLLVNSGTGTGAVTVNGSGTTLGGTGTITGTVTLGNTTPGAILNPGPQGTNGTSGSVGTLTTGALTLTGANTVHIDAFGTAITQWDKLVSTGAISLGTTSALDVTIASGLTFTAGSTYVLLNGTSLTGTFSGIADNQAVVFSGYLFTADYTSTGFDLVAVPEPGTWCAAALTLGAILLSQRRRLSRLLAWT